MKLQKINKVLLIRYLRIWNPNSKFESYINLFSLFITILCTVSIIIIISVNNGFKSNIKQILNDFSGEGRIYNFTYKPISIDDYNNIVKNADDLEISRFSTKECILKTNKISSGAFLYAFNSEDYFKNKIHKYINDGEYTDSTIIVGNLLLEKYNLKINDNISIITFNIDGIENIKKCKISGTFKTNIPDYDSHLIFGDIKYLKELIFKKDIKYEFLQVNNPNKTSMSEVINNDYLFLDVVEINNVFYKWLSSYDNPLKLLIIFLYIISLLNIANNNYYLVYYKKNQIDILLTLGVAKKSLKKIIILRSVAISFVGCLIGIIISYSILFFEKYFHLINLPSYVYFIDYLPIDISFYYVILILPYIISVTLVCSVLNYNLANK